MSSHSTIGPSSAERWINCPASVQLSAQCPRSPSNVYAAEGTVAHGLAEELVTDKVDDLELMARIGKVVVCDGFDIEITDEMVEGVMLYRDTIQDDMERMMKDPRPRAEFHRYAETKVHIKSVDPELWGTADYIQFIKGFSLKVYDFKYGRGVVEAVENYQMGMYGLGAMETIAGEAFDEVELVIIQPRAGHVDGLVRRWKAPKEWLAKFKETARAAVKETKDPAARLNPGDHCKWCPAKASCPALYKAAQDAAGADFSVVAETPAQTKGLPEVRLMSVEALAKAYSWREAVESWFGAVADAIQEKLACGIVVPGYKLVDGRSNRKWVDEEAVVAEWEKLLPEGALFEHKLLSPAKLEKLPGVGKGKIDHLTFKPEAKKAIARDTDPRPVAGNKAQDAFAVVVPEMTSREKMLTTVPVEDDLEAELMGAGAGAVTKPKDPLWPL